MPELKDRLRALDQIQAPDLREQIRGWEPRASRTEPSLRRVAIVLLAFVIAAAGIAFAIRAFRAAEPPVQPATTIENGKIAFVSDGINFMNPDGTGVQKIRESDPRDFDTRPLWSPDGMRIAFLHNAAGRFELLVFDVASGNITTVAGRQFDVDSPQWSPDGTRIAFVSGNDVFLINADGTGATRLTRGAFPTWSPDGTRIAFESQAGISLVNVDGSGEMTLVGAGFFPAWSPNDAKIAFIDADLQVSVVNADGTGLTQLTDIPNDDPGRPAWSPDGSEIAFEALREGDYDIYLVNADGTGFTNLTGEPGDENVPTWSPDGTKIAFIAGDAVSENPGNTGTFDVYVMSADGSNMTRLTEQAAPAYVLSWQPLRVVGENPRPTDTATPAETPVAEMHPRVSATIQVGSFPTGVAVGEGFVWVATQDPEGLESIWGVVKIDPETHEVIDAIPVQDAGDVAVGAGAVWVTSGEGNAGVIRRIDPVSDEVVATIPVGLSPSNVGFGEDAVWVTLNLQSKEPTGEVVRIDPATNEVVARIRVDGGWPRDVVIGEGAVWV